MYEWIAERTSVRKVLANYVHASPKTIDHYGPLDDILLV